MQPERTNLLRREWGWSMLQSIWRILQTSGRTISWKHKWQWAAAPKRRTHKIQATDREIVTEQFGIVKCKCNSSEVKYFNAENRLELNGVESASCAVWRPIKYKKRCHPTFSETRRHLARESEAQHIGRRVEYEPRPRSAKLVCPWRKWHCSHSSTEP